MIAARKHGFQKQQEHLSREAAAAKHLGHTLSLPGEIALAPS